MTQSGQLEHDDIDESTHNIAHGLHFASIAMLGVLVLEVSCPLWWSFYTSYDILCGQPSSLGGRIVCTQSVRPSVRLMPPIYSKQESRRNFKFSANMTLITSNRESKFEVKGQSSKLKVTGNENA